MKNTILSGLLIGAVLALGGAAVAHADYQPTSRFPAEIPYARTKEVPLMIIRFNEQEVAFQDPLYETMTKVFKAKPSAVFDIVSVSQKSSNKDKQKHYNQVAQDNANKVIQTFNDMGMPMSRLTIANTSENVQSSEIRIFAH